MTVTSTASLRTGTATASPATYTSLPGKIATGGFTRSFESEKSAPVDQQHKDERRIQPRMHGGALNRLFNAAPNQGERAKATRELKFLESFYRQRVQPGHPLNFSTFGKPASLSTGEGQSLVLRGKASANPQEPSGVLRFKNGKIDYAFLDSGAPMTARQQMNMVSASYDKIALALLNKR
ncbi:hypothetical protein ACSFA3_17370 [Variovorax sp. RHLX14]|uniref:hypothetical protein n=1 Tax=Variovorax sp. RHLX14 TaxID=1259731 RepID=UPI003F487C1E